ncbi:hypothetical protein EGR52_07305, partial [bacterium]|nr:hypothetical protein [bacterium]
MKIILDTDGTMTDFNYFISNEAIPYFKNKYNMEVINYSSLEIQDIFDMDNFFTKRYNVSLDEAKKYTKKALDEFWVHPRFLKYSPFNKFRTGLSVYIKEMIKEGHVVEVHTSRDKTTENTSVGKISRFLIKIQYLLNGIRIPDDKFYFYENDDEKIKNIISAKPDIVFEDKAYSYKGRRALCYMTMQDVVHQLFADSVWEEFSLLNKNVDEQSITDILRRLDLLDYKEKHPMTLSGGQKQR